jgi:hypothetical protein
MYQCMYKKLENFKKCIQKVMFVPNVPQQMVYKDDDGNNNNNNDEGEDEGKGLHTNRSSF